MRYKTYTVQVVVRERERDRLTSDPEGTYLNPDPCVIGEGGRGHQEPAPFMAKSRPQQASVVPATTAAK